MNNEMRLLYQKIKEGKISKEESVKLMKQFERIKNNKTNSNSDSKNNYEIYEYDEPYLKDHLVKKEQVIIGVTYSSLAMNTFFNMFPESESLKIERLTFVKPIELKENEKVELKVEPISSATEDIEFKVIHKKIGSDDWNLAATGSFKKYSFKKDKINIENIKGSMSEYTQLDNIYYRNPVLELGETFKTIKCLYLGEAQVLAKFDLSKSSNENHSYWLHPLVINSAFFGMSPLLQKLNNKEAFLPFGIKEVMYSKSEKIESGWVYAKLVRNSGEMVTFDVDVISNEGIIIAQFLGCSVKKLHLKGEQAINSNTYSKEALPVKATESPSNSKEQIEKYLVDKVLDLLVDKEKFSTERNFMELGVESAQLVKLTDDLKNDFDILPNPTVFFEYPNIEELTNYLAEEYKDKFNKLFTKQVDNKISKEENINKDRVKVIAKTVDNKEKIEKYLVDKVLDLLVDKDKFSTERNFMELGVESAQLVKLTDDLKNDFDILPNPTVFFEYPNIEELTEYLAKEYKDKFDKLFSKEDEEVFYEDNINDLKIEADYKAFEDSSFDEENKDEIDDDIAIIGMDGQFAQSKDLDSFWNNLCEKRDLIKEVPEDHWNYKPWFDANGSKDKTYCKWGSFIDDVDKFDAEFFNISPREANWMDPQLRLLLQSIYSTSENSGYINKIKGSNTGIFVGICFHDYSDKISELNLPVDPYSGTGNCQTVIANRISYMFDFNGPSVAVDTACSSSLFALHYACQAIKNKECDMAFVGGVNLLLSSWHYRYFSSIGALTHTGRCHTFDDSADGYVPGECVASILLKPLKQAIKDGDTIHAVIKGSSALHGGHTPSLTAPSVAGEENVILKAWERAGIDPRTLTYVEAHGTGTKLGDPIEINSLKNAFSHFTNKEKFCAIGSVKANIGHTEGASGLAGILKVILQMKHKKIAPLPFFNKLNRYIQLDQSPLYINKEVEDWKTENGIPRRAGISSFGFAGAYAHVIVEEHIPQEEKNRQNYIFDNYIMVLSAKNKERLVVKAKQLIDKLDKNESKNIKIANLAYTLQIAREAMEERLAVVVRTLDEFKDKLNLFINGNKNIENLYYSRVEGKKSKKDLPIDQWIKEKSYIKIAQEWINGSNIKWNRIYSDNKLELVDLPTYPFEKTSYWVKEEKVMNNNLRDSVYIHPLLEKNTSNFSEQRFSTVFTGNEFFLKDHVVNGKHLLPGVAYIEMARAALSSTLEEINEECEVKLRNIVWIRPIIFNGKSIEVNIRLIPEDNGEISFDIYSKNENEEEVIHSQGYAMITEKSEVKKLDINYIKDECSRKNIKSDECYEVFRKLGFEYGESHQGIKEVYLSENKALAKLSLPSCVEFTKKQYVLHPSLTDSALQSAISLIFAKADLENSKNAAVVPFALEEIEILEPCTLNMWAVIKYSNGSKTGERVEKLDIDLCDEEGKVCAILKGFSSRILDKNESEKNGEVPKALETTSQQVNINKEKIEYDNISSAKDLSSKKVIDYLKKMFSSTLNLPESKIDAKKSMDTYGIDSIIIMELTNKLEENFGSLSKTLFFEYQTIEELAEYFMETYEEKLIELLGVVKEEIVESSNEIDPEEVVLTNKQKSRFKAFNPKYSSNEHSGPLDIAIIGVSGKYPMSKDLDEYWENLKNGKDCISEIPKDRWNHSLYFDPDKNKHGKAYSKFGGFIDGVDKFDPLFFKITPRDAELMEPQERLFLQCAFETLEDAGYTRKELSKYQGQGLPGNVGVFVGVMYEEYQLYGAEETLKGRPTAFFGNPSSVANRVSYFCNFHGPSLAIDTMCSSSLTSIHLACQSILRGECEMALAGGVNVTIHPNKYLFLSQGRFLSSTGCCESFGEGGDGYIPGEGVGAVLLKPLSRAIEDGDNIYGVIKGTALNHGGKTNGYTVPNPRAQADVIGRAFKEAEINPRTISYIEAHGTGTSLGDPIEITGLNKVFQKYSKEKQYCAIGSAKSNIGHCESAAGIAGVTKVLLQLKHKQLVPSIHSDVLNSNINFKESPFVVQHKLEEWKRPIINIDGEIKEYPRLAAISAFGAGGSNANVVIEEYIPERDINKVDYKNEKMAIILSAKSKNQLLIGAERLLYSINKQQFSDNDLINISYTLQVGRESMEERLGILVSSIEELKKKLQLFISGETELENVFISTVKNNSEITEKFFNDIELQESVNRWLENREYDKLLELWEKGLDIDWGKSYKDNKPKRISLPTYPFVKERYWAPESNNGKLVISNQINETEAINPLLHKNVSSFSQQKFVSSFTGQEFFLSDHRINGKKVLPGVAYLEMAREAAERSLEFNDNELKVTKIKDIVWTQPITVDNDVPDVNINLIAQEDSNISYEIYTKDYENNKEKIIHNQGNISFYKLNEIKTMDLDDIKRNCNKYIISGKECYREFENIGMEYGKGHQGIEKLYIGENKILAKILLPEVITDTINLFTLHPSIMDSALQSVIGFSITLGKANLAVPFAMDQIDIIKECEKSMWSVVRYSSNNRLDSSIEKFDIDLCNDNGEICVEMKGVAIKMLNSKKPTAKAKKQNGTLTVSPFWQKNEGNESSLKSYDKHTIILCGLDDISSQLIERKFENANCIQIKSQSDNIEEIFNNYSLKIFEEIKGILKSKIKGNILVQVVTNRNAENQLLSGLSALLKTANQENNRFFGQLIEVESSPIDSDKLINLLKENQNRVEDVHIRYKLGERYTNKWRQINEYDDSNVRIWRDKGTYLITGGTGKLGLIFAEEIAKNTKEATIVLTGRSNINSDKEEKLNSLRSLGVSVEYMKVDITDKSDTKRLINSVVDKFGKLNGIIHTAGMIADNFILRKSSEDFKNVLAPKVNGVVNLDQASKNLKLDFIVFFSSVTGAFGNAGQVDYSTANAFMDSYAKYRNSLVDSNERYGKTLSINWPLWKQGGMHINEAFEKMMYEKLGMESIEIVDAVKAFYAALTSESYEVVVLQGNFKKLYKELLKMDYVEDRNIEIKNNNHSVAIVKQDNYVEDMNNVDDLTNNEQENNSNEENSVISEKVIVYLKKLISAITKLPIDKIEVDVSFENYGIDSVVIMQLTNDLEKEFGSLPKTLFFEYQTIKELGDYFVESHKKHLMRLFNIKQDASIKHTETNKNEEIKSEESDKKLNISKKTSFNNVSYANQNNDSLDIAIIGISGRYPKARNKEEFWDNIIKGMDCVTEIPKDRWDYKLYFDKDRNKKGKTYSKWGGFIDNVDKFDPLFFNISPKEAEIMDPQERLFLECAYETMEDAGYRNEVVGKQQRNNLNRNIGVFVGVMYQEYQLYGAQETLKGNPIALWGNSSGIANRVSYCFNLHGPSMAIDTMCSSSLTAINLACQNIKLGKCDMAIAGGVNVSIHPNKYLLLSQGNFVSSQGKCQSFGENGDGYVPGEGVGAVLLKPLSKAIKDGDNIYGVIKGISINHGGKTNGYTVPSPNSQAQVIEEALNEAKINPRTVSYIEAHGTGTSLGDPIEIAGLDKVFKKYTDDRQFCSIGSVKSNIGHCESAAGIAALTKVIMQMKYGKLAPSIHANILNSNIDFNDTSFKVQRNLEEWKRPIVKENGVNKEYPRIAGISAFGAGGSNAHLIVEEYIDEERKNRPIYEEASVIVLSARNEQQLRETVQNLLSSIEQQNIGDNLLRDMSYTLQVGREPMEERLAIVVNSIKELREKLTEFLSNKDEIENLYRGKKKHNKEIVDIFSYDEDIDNVISAWINKKKYSKLLNLWINGVSIDWNELYKNSKKPLKISLPTYPFAKERYWVPNLSKGNSLEFNYLQYAHPLVQRNTSDIYGLHYTSTFTGEEAFLKDHIVKSKYVLSGAATIEMARAAIETAIGEINKDEEYISIKNIVWNSPIVVDKNRTSVRIELLPDDNENVGYEIYKLENDKNTEINTMGRASIKSDLDKKQIDIKSLLNDCNRGIVHGSQCYDMFKNIGIEYGPSHRGIKEIYLGKEVAVAKLSLDLNYMDNNESFVLHPGMLDSAFQALIGSIIGKGKEIKNPMLPFAIDEIKIIDKCTGEMWAVIRSNISNDKVQKVNIELYNDLNNICAIIENLSVTTIENEINKEENIADYKTSSLESYSAEKEKIIEVLPKETEVTGNIDESLMKYLQNYLKKISANLLSVNVDDIDECDDISGYGFDQLMMEQLTDNLNRDLKINIADSLLLEYSTLNEIAEYLISEYKDDLLRYFDLRNVEKIFDNSKINQKSLIEKVYEYLKEVISKVTKMPINRIENDVLFDRYGIDSVMSMQLIDDLGKNFENLSRSLIFEYQTIEELGEYLIDNYKDKLTSMFISAEEIDNEIAQNSIEKTKLMPVEEVVKKKTTWKKSSNKSRNNLNTDDIAIIGVSGRYPCSKDINEFWKNLKMGKDCITEIPETRWNQNKYFNPDKDEKGKSYSKYGGFIDGVDEFDPEFFSMSPKEASVLDPQVRLYLECVFHTLENAGYTREELNKLYKGKVGVYVGAMTNQYPLFKSDIEKESIAAISSYSSIANRVSYFFDFHGPSVAVDTMCSSSAVAIHMACESIKRGECAVAVAGGINLSIHPKKYIGLSSTQMIGSNSNSRGFSDGDGYIPSEGVGAVLLKSLSKAINDKDHIWGVIKSTNINHGGHSNGPFVPNMKAQIQLIEDNFNKAGINPRTISYVESASNGSYLGDPIEVNALNKTFEKFTSDKDFCSIGTVKSNIGHAEAASGISQLTKVLLQLKHKKLVPSIKADPLNPDISFENTPFHLQRQLDEWNRMKIMIKGELREIPLRATISSFGAGGSNAHIIIEEYIPKDTEVNSLKDDNEVIVFSAKNKETLRKVIENALDFIKQSETNISLSDLAYTLQVGREEMEYRIAMIVNSIEQLVDYSTEYLRDTENIYSGPIYTGVVDNILGLQKEILPVEFSKEEKLNEIASHWVRGGKVSWNEINKNKNSKRIPLPTYPFSNGHYWISKESRDNNQYDFILNQNETEVEDNTSTSNIGTTREEIKNSILEFLSSELEMDINKINLNKDIQDYGIDSIVIMKMIRKFEKAFNFKVKTREMMQCRTVESLVNLISNKLKEYVKKSNEKQEAFNNSVKDKETEEYMNPKIIDALEKYEQGILTEEEIENLINEGEK